MGWIEELIYLIGNMGYEPFDASSNIKCNLSLSLVLTFVLSVNVRGFDVCDINHIK